MPPDDRFGDPLPPAASARLGSARMRHTGPILFLGFLPGNRLLSTGAGATSARVWCARDGHLLAALPCGPFACVDAAARGPAEVVLALGRGDVELWCLRQATLVAKISTGIDGPLVLVLPDRDVLIYSGGRVIRWDPEAGTSEVSEWALFSGRAFARPRGWSRHDDRAVLLGQGGFAVYDWKSGNLVRSEVEAGCTWAEVRKDGEELLVLGSDGTLSGYPLGEGDRREIARSYRVVAQTATGRLVGQYRGGGAFQWIENGETFGDYQDEVPRLVADPQTERVAFADKDHGLHVLDDEAPDPGRFGLRFPHLLGFGPEGQVVAGRPSRGVGVARFDLESGEEALGPWKSLPLQTMAVAYRGESEPPAILDSLGMLTWGDRLMRVQVSPKRWGQLLVQGDIAVVRTQERELSAFRLTTQERLWSATTPANVNDFVTDPAGEFLVLASNRRQLLFFLFRNGKSQGSLRLPANPIHGLAFHPRGREFFALTGGRHIYRVDLLSRTFEKLAELPEEGGMQALAVSGCGRWVALVDSPDTVRVYPLRAQGLGTPVILEGHAAPIAALAFSPRGELVTTSQDGTGLVWSW